MGKGIKWNELYGLLKAFSDPHKAIYVMTVYHLTEYNSEKIKALINTTIFVPQTYETSWNI